MNPRCVFVTGSTGYVGSRLIPRLLERGYEVRALARKEPTGKLPPGCRIIQGNPLDSRTFATQVTGVDTFVQLVGAAKPAPWKGPAFRAIDLVSARASIEAAASAGVRHFVYVSVAHPAPIMKAYIAVRQGCEEMILVAGCRPHSSDLGIFSGLGIDGHFCCCLSIGLWSASLRRRRQRDGWGWSRSMTCLPRWFGRSNILPKRFVSSMYQKSAGLDP